MTPLQIIAFLLVICASGAYINQRFTKLPPPLAMTFLGLATAVSLQIAQLLGLVDIDQVEQLLRQIDFPNLLLHGLLGFMLFAGALSVDFNSLKKWAIPVANLAIVGVLVSAFATGGLLWLIAQAISLDLPFIWCLLFGSIIASTDPIAALSIVSRAGAPRHLKVKLVGESLFNDGTSIMLYLVILGVIATGEVHVLHLGYELFVAPLGGALLGAVVAWLATLAIAKIDHHPTELLVTVALAAGVYGLAEALTVSAPIASVAAGLVVGHVARNKAMSQESREHIDSFWESVDEILNTALFALIGLELLLIDLSAELLYTGLAVWVAVLIARWLGVLGALGRKRKTFGKGATTILVWGGMRGGISLALALSVPASPQAQIIVALTFVVVTASSVVQGMTLGRVIKRAIHQPGPEQADDLDAQNNDENLAEDKPHRTI